MSAPGPADDLLGQIMGLLQQYLGQGGDPAPIMEAVAAGAEAGGPPGGMPPEGMPPEGQPQDMGGVLPDMTGMAPEGGMPESVPGANPLRGASDMAMEDLMKRKSKV
jgi:hypothetical protein